MNMDLQHRIKLVGQARDAISELASDGFQAKEKGEFIVSLRRIEADARYAIESLVNEQLKRKISRRNPA